MTPCGWNCHHRLAGWAKIDPDKLFPDFIALVPLIRDVRNKAPASTGDLEQRAMVIMGQISTAPPPLLKVWTTKVTAAATAWIETAVKDGSLAGYDKGPVRYDDGVLVKSQKRGPKQTTTEPPPGCVICLPAPTATPPWPPSPLSSPKKPPSAVDWAITITDPAQRTAALNQVWKDWKAHAPEEAASYFKPKQLAIPQ